METLRVDAVTKQTDATLYTELSLVEVEDRLHFGRPSCCSEEPLPLE
jgi:hypothetical protein